MNPNQPLEPQQPAPIQPTPAPQQPAPAPQSPIAPATPQPAPAPQPTFGAVPPQPVQPAPFQPSVRSGKRKFIIIGLVALLLLVVIPAIAFYFLSQQAAKKSAVPAIDAKPVADLAKKTSLTAADVSAMDKDNAFWAYYKNAAQQSKLAIVKDYYYEGAAGMAKSQHTAKRTGFDYTTKKIVQAVDQIDADGTRVRYRCYDGKEFVLFPTSSRGWREKDGGDKSVYCKLDSEAPDLNDGVNTGGLTAPQAETMIQYLRKQSGLVTVDKLALAEHQGKQYLRFDVELHPISVKKDKIYLGNQWLMWAFKETGLKPADHPYGYLGAGGNGLKIAYFVDPATKLPVYSEIGTTPIKDSTGADKPGSVYSFYRTQYSFGALPDVTGTKVEDINITW